MPFFSQTIYDFWSLYGYFIVNIVAVLIIYFIYKIIVRAIRKGYDDIGLTESSANTIIFVFRVIFFAIGMALTISILSSQLLQTIIDPSWIVGITAMLGTAIGLASSKALGNIVSGLYVIITRPFKVGDYVKINGEEGIVKEITLNYTQLLCYNGNTQFIPNSNVTNSDVLNYSIKPSDLLTLLGEWPVEDCDKKCIERLEDLKNFNQRVYLYNFDISVKIETPIKDIKKVFNKIVRKWEKVFSYRPIYIYKKVDYVSQTFTFSIIVEDPKIILNRKGDFIEDVLNELQINSLTY